MDKKIKKQEQVDVPVKLDLEIYLEISCISSGKVESRNNFFGDQEIDYQKIFQEYEQKSSPILKRLKRRG